MFQKGQHPYTGVPFRSHADGALSVAASAAFRQTRGQLIAGLRKHRLRGKTKPWASALLGVFARPAVRAEDEAEKASREEAEESEVPVHAAGDDEDFVFGAVDLDGCEEAAQSSQAAPAKANPLPSASHATLQSRLVHEWRERKRRRALNSPVSR